jgi:uncharacterized membrane protein HdeD (DUF308 family)
MSSLRPEKIVNLLSAILVLIAGFYVIFFMPITLSPAAKVIIGLLLLVYFSFRMRYFKKKYGNNKSRTDRPESIKNKGLDKNSN